MCLEKIDRIYPTPIRRVRYGYKVMFKRRRKYRFEFQNKEIGYKPLFFSLPVGKWLESTHGIIGRSVIRGFVETSEDKIGSSMGGYETGFHIFIHKRDAQAWAHPDSSLAIVRVKCRNVVAEGIQSILFFDKNHAQWVWATDCKVIVAKEMQFLKEV